MRDKYERARTPDPQDVLAEGETRLPEAERFREGDTVWTIGEPPTQAAVFRDSGHPRWLTILAPTTCGPRVCPCRREDVRTTERRAATATVLSLRRRAFRLEQRSLRLESRYGLTP